VIVGANIRWGMIFKMIPERQEFSDYAARIAARPACLPHRSLPPTLSAGRTQGFPSLSRSCFAT